MNQADAALFFDLRVFGKVLLKPTYCLTSETDAHHLKDLVHAPIRQTIRLWKVLEIKTALGHVNNE